MNKFLDKFSKQTEINDNFVAVPKTQPNSVVPYYFTEKGDTEIKHRVYSEESRISTLDMDNLDLYTSLPEVTLCYPRLMLNPGGFDPKCLENWFEVEPLNNTSDFLALKADDVVIVTLKDTKSIVARGRHLKCGLNTVELYWGDEHDLELFTFYKSINDFYKLIRIK